MSLNFIKLKIKTIIRFFKKRNIEKKFDKDLGLYRFKKDNKFLYSNTHAHFDSYYKKIFVEEIYKFISETESPNIIDCGANIGLGVHFWKIEFPNSKIIAFEPDPVIFKALIKNSENFSNIELVNKAVSNTVSTKKFSSNEKLSGSLNLTKKLDKVIEVNTVLLSTYINQKIHLLKIDIEGEENIVIPEIEQKLYLVENIFIEYHSFINQDQSLSKILRILEINGFRYYLESEVNKQHPFINNNAILNQDLQINIWAKKNHE